MFLQAGFNGRHFATGIKGWTRHVRGNVGGFAPAELIQFEHGNDFAWHGERFLAWGDSVVLGTHYEFKLDYQHQYDLPLCHLDTRQEEKGLTWED